jgi:hypothetical protein
LTWDFAVEGERKSEAQAFRSEGNGPDKGEFKVQSSMFNVGTGIDTLNLEP